MDDELCAMGMKAAAAGVTGLVGGHLLRLLAEDKSFSQVTVLTRRDMDLPHKFSVIPGALESPKLPAGIETAFCCLGTTMAKAGSQEAFRHVDYELVLAFAKAARNAGAQDFVLVSSLGADSRSSNFYLRVKGEAEEAVQALGFATVIILRPSLLMGDRKESRPGERFGQLAMRLMGRLMIGRLGRYRGVDAHTVAQAMLKLAKTAKPGAHIIESETIAHHAGL